VASIWQQHQANYVGEVNIDMNDAQCVAIYRLGLHVDVICLSAAEHALWCSALARESLAAMLGAAFAVDESFDVQTALQAGFAREFVVDLSLTASHVWP
jgi:hypothetical protein